MKNGPLPTNYLSTQEYVAAFDLWAEKELTGYSRRSFSKWAKVASPNFLSLVISKKRGLKGAWLEGFIAGAKLPEGQARYLRLLSQFESCRSREESSRLLIQVQNCLAQMNMKSLASDQLEILTKPEAWTIYHMLDLIDQKSNPLWIKQRLRFQSIDATEITRLISLLKTLGLVQMTNGQLQSQKKIVQSPNQVKKQANAIFHKHVLREASQVLDALEPSERAFGSLTATVNKDQIESLKQEINRFGQHLLTKYSSVKATDGEVMRLNIQLYPLTQKNAEK